MSFDQRQIAVIAQAALGAPLADESLAALQQYLGELERWNRTHNLTAVREPARMLAQHLSDCLAVVPPLREYLAGRAASRLLDVGSGGGLPGAVIAIAAPEFDVTCIDAVAKKAAFVRHVAGALGLPHLYALHGRVEDHQPAAPYDLVVSRAFASLADFVALTRHLLSPTGAWMAMKGRVPDDETAALPGDVEVFHVKPLQVPGLDAQRCLVWMRFRRA